MSLILSGTDGLSDIDGSAATPAIRGTDANTGIFFGTDIIGFSEGGVEAMRINASGNVVMTGTLTTSAGGIAKASLPAGSVLQVVNYQTGAVATGTTSMPRDDTIPQSTEGNEYMSLAITPTNTNSKLIIYVVFNYTQSNGTNNSLQLALFQDSVSNALAAAQQQITADHFAQLELTHYMTAGTVSATTFKVRAGANSTGTLTFNGQSSSRFMGGVMASSITIMEIAV